MHTQAVTLPDWKSRNWIFLALAPALGGAVSGLAALTLAAGTFAIMLVVGVLMLAFRPVLNKAGAIATTVFTAVTLSLILDLLLASAVPDVHGAMTVFVVLIPANALVLRQALIVDRHGPLVHFGSSLLSGVLFAVLLVVIGVIREVLGSGAVFGAELGNFGISELGGPAMTLVFAGLVVALFNQIRAGGNS